MPHFVGVPKPLSPLRVAFLHLAAPPQFGIMDSRGERNYLLGYPVLFRLQKGVSGCRKGLLFTATPAIPEWEFRLRTPKIGILKIGTQACGLTKKLVTQLLAFCGSRTHE